MGWGLRGEHTVFARLFMQSRLEMDRGCYLADFGLLDGVADHVYN